MGQVLTCLFSKKSRLLQGFPFLRVPFKGSPSLLTLAHSLSGTCFYLTEVYQWMRLHSAVTDLLKIPPVGFSCLSSSICQSLTVVDQRVDALVPHEDEILTKLLTPHTPLSLLIFHNGSDLTSYNRTCLVMLNHQDPTAKLAGPQLM